jgi:hypothetical protein
MPACGKRDIPLGERRVIEGNRRNAHSYITIVILKRQRADTVLLRDRSGAVLPLTDALKNAIIAIIDKKN